MKFPPKLIYVAGAISAPSPEERAKNVELGRLAGIAVWKQGGVPIVPHLNSLGAVAAGVSISDIYLGDLEMLQRCDAMYRIPGWEMSKGVAYETAWAKHNNIPIFDSLTELGKWIDSKEQKHPDPELKLA